MVYDLKSGGFALHQILGWHHLICSIDTCQAETVAALKPQNYQAGLFQRPTWMLTSLGVDMFLVRHALPAKSDRATLAPARCWAVADFSIFLRAGSIIISPAFVTCCRASSTAAVSRDRCAAADCRIYPEQTRPAGCS